MREKLSSDDPVAETEHTVPRRGLVAGALALTAALVLDNAEPAAAADPNDVVKGVLNTTTTTTTLSNTTNIGATGLRVQADSSVYGIGIESSGTAYGVIGRGGQYAGVYGDASGSNAAGVTGLGRATTGKNYGVTGHSSSLQGYGVLGSCGDFADAGTAVFGRAGDTDAEPPAGPIGVCGSADFPTGIGGVFAGGQAALRLMPSLAAGAPTTGTHDIGELIVSSDGRLYLCSAAGTPGTWVRMQAAAPTLSLLPTPDRFVDTRSGLGGVQGPVAAQSTNTISMTGRNGESANPALQIPDAATSIIGNLTVIGAAGILLGSFVTLWPGGARPTVSNINFGPSNATGAVANSFVVALTGMAGGHRGISVFNNAACDYILDVTGYYIA